MNTSWIAGVTSVPNGRSAPGASDATSPESGTCTPLNVTLPLAVSRWPRLSQSPPKRTPSCAGSNTMKTGSPVSVRTALAPRRLARLAPVEQEAAGDRRERELRVARVERTAPEPAVRGALALQLREQLPVREEPRVPGDLEVVSDELADRAVAGGDLADHLVGGAPVGAAAAQLARDQQAQEPGLPEPLHLRVRRLVRPVALERVGRQLRRDSARRLQPLVMRAGRGARGGGHRHQTIPFRGGSTPLSS